MRSGEQMQLHAAEVRRETIAAAHESFILRWQEQAAGFKEIEAAGYPPGSLLEYYVLDDQTGFPFEGVQSQRSLKMKLQPDFNVDAEDTGRFMYVHMPIPDDIVLDEQFDIAALPKPEKIGIELHESGAVVKSYVLSADEIMEFENEAITGRQLTEADRADELFLKRLAKRVDTRLALTSELSETMTNWSAQIIRMSRLGDEHITDF